MRSRPICLLVALLTATLVGSASLASAAPRSSPAPFGFTLDAPVTPLALRVPEGSVWRSTDEIGQRSFLLLCSGEKAAFDPALVAAALSSSHRSLGSDPLNSMETLRIVALPRPVRAVTRTANNTATVSPILLQASGAVRRTLNVPARGLVAWAVDRAGFLRRRETFPDARLLTPASLAALLFRLQAALPPSLGAALQAGSMAPDFALRDMNGQVRRLSELRGKKNLLLTFFPKCFTSNCLSQLSSLRDHYPQLQAQDIAVWAVSVDPAEGPKGQRAFARGLRLPFPLLPDMGRNVCILYGAANAPSQLAARISVFIDKQGIVRWMDKQIDVKTHGPDVLARWRQINQASGTKQ